jgi:Leucine-rich repeat (LRR) protein
MRGSVPTSIFKLPQLRELVLSGNTVDFSFEGIAQADNLVTLYLDSTNVRSITGIGSAPNLQTVNLADNQLQGEVPNDIFFLTTLKKLDLGYNAFSGQLHNVIGALTSLESLHLYHNQFTGRLPAGLGDLTNLQELNLAENSFVGTIPRELNDLSNLRFLSLQREGGILGTNDVGINQGANSLPGVGLTGTLPPFDGLPYLTELYLGGNGLTGSIPFTFLDGVIDTSSLIKVDLTSNDLTGIVPASLTQFDQMSLFIGGNRITGIAEGLCNKASWLGGAVGTSGCNAILCPAGTYSSIGRQDSAVVCQSCETGTDGILGSFICQSAGEAQEGSERLILESLFKAMGGPNWIDNTNWLSDASICDWFGIDCLSDSIKSVGSINLSNNRLSGTFPTQIYGLPSLLELNLRGNDISISFDGIANAAGLQLLNLEETGLNSIEGIGQATSLRLVRLDGNKLTTFPLAILSLPALEVLSLSDNSFTPQEMPSSLQTKTSLTYFACAGCGFTGPVPTWLGSLVNMQYLKLSQNAFTGTLPTELETLRSLKHLDLAEQATLGRAISGQVLSFANQTELIELFLQHNNFQGTIPAEFLQSVNKDGLVTVDLRYNALTGSIPVALSSFNQMNLFVASNNMEDPVPQALCSKNWNQGDVSRYGCNGLVCPKGTYNSYGRATGDVECFPCDDPNYSIYLGTTSCGTGVEHQALIFLYRSYGGANWKSDNNWLRTDDHCSWEGITCHQSGDLAGLVQRIELPDNNLVGSMMFALIWQMQGLEYVDLSKNSIALPFDSVGNAINLDTVILTETLTNSLVGIGSAQSLRSLHLTSSSLTGPIPDELYTLTGLEELYLSHNELTGTISANIGDLKQLKDLYLFGNKIEGTIPTEIGLLARAEHLSLGKNRLQGSIPRQITSLPLLEFMSLENEAGKIGDAFTPGSGLSGPLPPLDGLPRINELYLAHNSFTGTIPDHFLQGVFDKNTKITVDLSFNQVEGSIPAGLSNFQGLNLLLAGNLISDVSAEICNNLGWMSGEVTNGCDAILCPPGFYNRDGRRVDAESPCEPCTFPGEATHYGSTSCGPGDAATMDDRSILFNFYDATGGSGWTMSTGWRSDTPFCSWFGVTCETGPDGDQLVSELNLPSNNLKGIVPSIIFHLNGLKKLDVRQNDVDMTFNGIDAAESLSEIYLDETLVNSLAGIGQAPSLTTLHVHKNPFGWQRIPDELFEVRTLVDLNLSDSMFSGPLSPLVSQLTRLQRLTLTDNALSGSLPSELGQLAALMELDISNNSWIGTIPSSWSGMVSLQALFIDNAKIETAGITGPLLDFSTMPNLRELHLAHNQLTGSIPSTFISGITDTSNVVTVRLNDNHLIGTVPSSLATFRRLNIDLVGNLFTALGDGLCNQPNWNDGAVGRYSCDAILCPAGEFSPSGRQTSADDPCQPCPGAEASPYFGVTYCVSLAKAREREILGALYESTNGNGWRNNDGWLEEGRDVCTWYGISCKEDSTVESIRLGSNNLVGTMPSEIYQLPHLKSLWVYSNPLELSFDGIAEASSLRSLLVDSTKLRSLAGIGAGESLVEVDVGFNQLTGPIPAEELELLSNLQSFSATNNALTGTVPDFTSLRRLNTLRLSENQLNGDLPAFSRHPELGALDLSKNRIAGTVPSNFLDGAAGGQSLFVDLSDNFISGKIPGNLTRFNDVTIYLRDNRIDGIDPSLCSQDDWNEGDVGKFRCDGILCPAGSFSPTGRASTSTPACEPCSKNQYYGGTRCGSGASSYFNRPGIITALLLCGTTLLTCFLQ